MSDLEGIILSAQTLSEGVRMLVRYPPLKRNTVATETMKAFINETPTSAQQPSTAPAASSNNSRWDYRGGPASSELGKRLRLEAAREHTSAYELPSVVIAPLLVPRLPLLGKPLTVAIDDALFVGYPIPISHDAQQQVAALTSKKDGEKPKKQDENGLSEKRSDVVAINVAFCLPRVKSNETAIHPLAASNLQRISRDIAMALRHEEERCRWLSSEVSKMTNARELWLRAQQQAEQTPGAIRPDMFDLTEYLLSVSPLCVQLTDTFRRLRLSGSAQICFNNWTSLSASIWPVEQTTALRPQLRPYHTILLTDHELADIAQRCSPAMALFLSHARPSKSFRDMARETGIPLRHLYSLAAHLAHWRSATITNVIAMDSIYVINPRPLVPIFTSIGNLATKFSVECPSVSKLVLGNLSSSNSNDSTKAKTKAISLPSSSCSGLAALLHMFTVTKTLREHISALNTSNPSGNKQVVELQTKVFIQAVCWMLSHDLLIQIQTHIYLSVPPERVKERFANLRSPLFTLLFTLLPHLENGNSIEELKWKTNVSSKDIDELVQHFPGLLIKVLHESVSETALANY